MKKNLSILGLAMFSQFSFAQANCAGALAVASGSTTTVSSYTGTYLATCAGTGSAANLTPPGTPAANWYKYTPTTNGEVTVSSNLPQNDGLLKSDDTRVSIITGACTTLSCYGGNDDVSATNFLSSTTFPVTAGTTYYIVWDNRWTNLGFDFTLNFNSVSCVRPSEFSINTPYATSTTNATVGWAPAVGTPASYDVEYGATGFAQGSGTTINTPTTSASISGAAGTTLSYYLRSNCTGTQSAWIGPFRAFTAVNATTTSYPYGFDNTSGFAADGWSGSWSTNNAAGNPQAGAQMVFSNSSTVTTTATDRWLYSRPIYLTAGNSYQITFYLRNFTGTTPVPAQSLQLKVGNQPNPAAQTTTVWSTTSFTASTWTQMTTQFNASTTGVYYFGFYHNTPGAAGAVSLALDTFNVAGGVLGIKEIDMNNVKFTLHPNPTSEVLNIKLNSKINSVSVVDMTGRKVDVKIDGNQVDVSSLPAGTYLINVETKDGISTEKFIKK
ncbi:T9SS-dependent choice-of-anchor J family protein [Chryseobacterium wangxinyae]|uniref:T9SS-dependent choice-of-anchor J family protein n=1 Tax=Chryseobacterium sp. CY353 TaxID=2997334 RepID=UPI00226E71AC|nr:T9SS type A sorting domain-containing protein [Chryseobacterium sp. CY353]MCY0968258.1 T9SS type A sorting domain-containing protein [Chryseobacterium sp. CY353]